MVLLSALSAFAEALRAGRVTTGHVDVRGAHEGGRRRGWHLVAQPCEQPGCSFLEQIQDLFEALLTAVLVALIVEGQGPVGQRIDGETGAPDRRQFECAAIRQQASPIRERCGPP